MERRIEKIEVWEKSIKTTSFAFFVDKHMWGDRTSTTHMVSTSGGLLPRTKEMSSVSRGSTYSLTNGPDPLGRTDWEGISLSSFQTWLERRSLFFAESNFPQPNLDREKKKGVWKKVKLPFPVWGWEFGHGRKEGFTTHVIGYLASETFPPVNCQDLGGLMRPVPLCSTVHKRDCGRGRQATTKQNSSSKK